MKSYFQIVATFLCLSGVALPTAAAVDCDLDLVKNLRLRGELELANRSLATAIDKADIPSDCRIEQHLEMARILDRVGLHQNTRPVVEALTHIDFAAKLLDSASEYSRAAVELAYADYYYRAEMSGRKFTKAEDRALRAIRLFAEIGDGYGQADAVHRQGLIEFQRHNLDSAEALFRESMHLDIAAGERTFFRGEYERHIGFVVYRRGDIAGAVRHFERSLKARRDAGAIDASLFAAVVLGSALIELGRRDEAKTHLEYALGIARRIESPVGLKRVDAAMEKLAATTPTTD
jgi:tetratricopeptide (TPR) repeat protein